MRINFKIGLLWIKGLIRRKPEVVFVVIEDICNDLVDYCNIVGVYSSKRKARRYQKIQKEKIRERIRSGDDLVYGHRVDVYSFKIE